MTTDPAPLQRLAIVYAGRVQGVGFRATTRDALRGLPITGFVRNESDGTVRLEIQGDPATLAEAQRLVDARLGQLVTSVNVHPMALDPAEHTFGIQR